MRHGIMTCAVALLVSTAAAAQADKDLVLHYTFDDGAGDVVKDRSGKGNHGKIHGAKFVKVGGGYALEFDGEDDYVSCPLTPTLQMRDVVSVEVWVGPAGRPGKEVAILTEWPVFVLRQGAKNDLCYWYVPLPHGMAASGGLTPGVWHHLVGTFDNGKLNLFMDGKLVGTAVSKYDKIWQPRIKELWIGKCQNFFKGRIGEVKIYHRVLAASEVKKNYEAAKTPYLAEAPPRIAGPGDNPARLPDDPITPAPEHADAKAPAPMTPGPVAHYTFDEGAGDVAHDKSGYGNHGKIYGAEFVKVGKGCALQFDGVDDYVHCGPGKAFDVREAFTIEFWMKETGGVPAGEPPVMGKGWGIYLLTRCMGRLYAYMASGAVNCLHGTPTPGIWHHIVLTFRNKTFLLYVDGTLACQRTTKAEKVASKPDVPFWIGRVFNGQGAFDGLLDEVRFYNRAISAGEVLEHYRETGVNFGLAVRALFVPTGKRLIVQADLRNVRELPKGGTVKVEVLADRQIVGRKSVGLPAAGESVETSLDTSKWEPGEYSVRAAVMDADGRSVGATATCTARLQETAFGVTKEAYRRLNNLVVEMINLDGAAAERAEARAFTLDRDGWVFVSTTAETPGAAKVSVLLDSGACIEHAAGKPETQETMRHLPKGRHTLTLKRAGKCRVRRVIVRSVADLVFHALGTTAAAGGIERYAEFLKRHVYPNFNLYVLHRAHQIKNPKLRKVIAEWGDDGRKFTSQDFTPLIQRDVVPYTGENLYKYLSEHSGFNDPLLSGLYISEFNGGAYGKTPAWVEAIEKLGANPKFHGRKLYLYGTGFYINDQGRQLMQKLMDFGYRLSWELYLNEQPTEPDAWFLLRQQLIGPAERYNRMIPGSMGATTVNIGTFSDIGDSCDWYPDVNIKTYFEMMLNIMANDPQFRGLNGIQVYAVIGTQYPEFFVYADEEIVRWMSALFRHYGVEGNTDLLSTDPYRMTHLKNGDFADDTDGWKLSPAEPARQTEGGQDSIKASRFKGLGNLEGRWPAGSDVGDTVLAMRRSKDKPNVIAQEIRDLTPGRLYSIRMFSVDKENPKDDRPHALVINVANVDFISDKSFHRVRPNLHRDKDYPRGELMLNCYRYVFRARGKTAKLTISDWKDKDNPGGPIGQELMLNFIQVQPYFEE